MLNAITPLSQTVAVNQPILYASNRISCGATKHEPGSGSVLLTKPGVYRVTFEGNVSTATAGPIVLNIVADGEVVPSTQVNLTATANDLYSVSRSTYIRVCGCDTVRVSFVNASLNPIYVASAGVLAERLS